jgi:hypothetical protein
MWGLAKSSSYRSSFMMKNAPSAVHGPCHGRVKLAVDLLLKAVAVTAIGRTVLRLGSQARLVSPGALHVAVDLPDDHHALHVLAYQHSGQEAAC